ncbi:TetR/AcrR family transcriptional regulator [Actinomadura fibrosa]|uniref:TetR/AcrR family transcriptional regulator n=1 Tax=Actinomadura fibrosa TaxID=111802 RepID=A0ABW2XP82_9ACTN|nr:TetR/AcrR family transcriptional regulator [Actinomadura fibrosa]
MAVTDAEGKARPGRGRPQLHEDAVILSAALAAFASAGYEAMSIRSLGRDLGLSHGTLNQRFGSKEQLFYAAVDHGFGGLSEAMARHLTRWPEPRTDLDALRNGLRAFLLASFERPELVRLMNTLGITGSQRLDYVFDRYIEPTVEPLRRAALISRPSEVSPISGRELFFLTAHGAAAPFTLKGLSDRFNAADGPLDPEVYADHMASILLRTLGL